MFKIQVELKKRNSRKIIILVCYLIILIKLDSPTWCHVHRHYHPFPACLKVLPPVRKYSYKHSQDKYTKPISNRLQVVTSVRKNKRLEHFKISKF